MAPVPSRVRFPSPTREVPCALDSGTAARSELGARFSFFFPPVFRVTPDAVCHFRLVSCFFPRWTPPVRTCQTVFRSRSPDTCAPVVHTKDRESLLVDCRGYVRSFSPFRVRGGDGTICILCASCEVWTRHWGLHRPIRSGQLNCQMTTMFSIPLW